MNPFDMLKNIQSLKENIGQIQEEMAAITATGSSGGNIVNVTLNGKMEMVDLRLDPICVDPRDIKMLQDLIISAHHDAMEKVQNAVKEKYGPMLNGMNIPGL